MGGLLTIGAPATYSARGVVNRQDRKERAAQKLEHFIGAVQVRRDLCSIRPCHDQ
jgi:hypothetical protein